MIGIYRIRNKINNHKYVGSSVDIRKRWWRHRTTLRRDSGCIVLQNAWNKYEEENFEFEILLICEEFELFRYEQWFLDNKIEWGVDYNIAKDAKAPWRGETLSNEHRNKISKTRIESGVAKGKNNPMYGKHHTKEARENIGRINKIKRLGKKHTKQTKQKMSKAREEWHKNYSYSGENHPNSRFKKEHIIMIRKMYKTGEYTQAELSSIFNTSQSQISGVINGNRWSHI